MTHFAWRWINHIDKIHVEEMCVVKKLVQFRIHEADFASIEKWNWSASIVPFLAKIKWNLLFNWVRHLNCLFFELFWLIVPCLWLTLRFNSCDSHRLGHAWSWLVVIFFLQAGPTLYLLRLFLTVELYDIFGQWNDVFGATEWPV